MDNLKPCGCGATPETLLISDGSTFRWRYISGSCCGEWEHECRVPTVGDNATPKGVKAACVKAWNDLPRPTADRIADLESQLTAANARVEGLEGLAYSVLDAVAVADGRSIECYGRRYQIPGSIRDALEALAAGRGRVMLQPGGRG